MTTVAKRRRALRGRVMGLLLGLVLVVAGGVALASPPPSAAFADDDGRTWLPRTAGDTTQLLLVNGISGSIEAESSVTGAGRLTFAGRAGDSTVFRADGGLVLVGNGDHDAVRLADVPDRVAVAGDRALGLTEEGAT